MTTETVNFSTPFGVEPLVKSHLNLAPYRSDPERQSVGILEERPEVYSFTPNHERIGLVIMYEHDGRRRPYYPDFLIKLASKPREEGVANSDQLLILEIKGIKGEIHDPDLVNAKNAAGS